LPPARFPLPHAQINPKSTSFWADVSTNMERHKRCMNDLHHVAHAKTYKMFALQIISSWKTSEKTFY
jgi:hypothetical protein